MNNSQSDNDTHLHLCYVYSLSKQPKYGVGITFMKLSRLFSYVTALLFISVLSFNSFAEDNQLQNAADVVPQAWQMLDYLATDYASAVENGEVIDEFEYLEMQEFSETISNYFDVLPEHAIKAELILQGKALQQLVEAKAANTEVNKKAHELADLLVEAYPIPTAPVVTPDLELGAQLYQQHCASCHGVNGAADGPLSAELDPPAIAFNDVERANQRSPLSLFQTITHGLEGTSMVAYEKTLSADERWALAYFSGVLAYMDKLEAGSELWDASDLARAQISNLTELSRARVEQFTSVMGDQEAEQLIGFLRANPEELDEALSGIALARGRLKASINAYQDGDSKNAVSLALSSYLDGVEPVEPILNAKSNALRIQIELAMGVYRTGLSQGIAVNEAVIQAKEIDSLLVQAQEVIGAGSYDATTVFLGAFTVLLREGLEALLIVVAVMAFLSKAGRRETMPYVHAGWITALFAGALTWFVARYFINISGASRELTEGFSALFASVMLLSVGLWMHQKSVGNRWQEYIKAKMSNALSKKSAWFLFILVFVSVYREVFETILFYAALWTEGLGLWFIAGMLSAVALLAVIAWFLIRTSRQLPIATFFSASSALIAVLAVVLAGKGISALQEAGWVAVSLAPTPHVELLGMFPTWQTVSAQLVVLAVIIIGYFYNKREV